jgi:hypothetical protein
MRHACLLSVLTFAYAGDHTDSDADLDTFDARTGADSTER